MSIFDRFKQPTLSSEELREQLLDAAAHNNEKHLRALCSAHHEQIRAAFPAWQKVPPEVRSNHAALQRYAQGLIEVARHFAENLGEPDLLERLSGGGGLNPLVVWQGRLGEARTLLDALRLDEAEALLGEALTDVGALEGGGADALLPLTHEYLGEVRFQKGDADGAVAPMSEALAVCERSGDQDGVLACLGSLYEIHRYRGDGAAAAGFAERRADAWAQSGHGDEAERLRRQAALVRAGEPLNRVLIVASEVRYELDDPPPRGSAAVRFVFERNRPTLRAAVARSAEGEAHGVAGRFADAVASFRAAARADRFDPQSRYLEGLSLLHLGRYAEAVRAYEETERLAPGWYNCRADQWLARQLAAGALPRQLFSSLTALEDGALPPAEKVRLAQTALDKHADWAPLYLYYGAALAALGQQSDARAAYRRGLGCAVEPDVRTRLLVQLALVAPVGAERRASLTEARELDGNRLAAAMARLILAQDPAT